ncbi:unnamed protein product, partial [Ectocarpus sp. 8 AP-2014]
IFWQRNVRHTRLTGKTCRQCNRSPSKLRPALYTSGCIATTITGPLLSTPMGASTPQVPLLTAVSSCYTTSGGGINTTGLPTNSTFLPLCLPLPTEMPQTTTPPPKPTGVHKVKRPLFPHKTNATHAACVVVDTVQLAGFRRRHKRRGQQKKKNRKITTQNLDKMNSSWKTRVEASYTFRQQWQAPASESLILMSASSPSEQRYSSSTQASRGVRRWQ